MAGSNPRREQWRGIDNETVLKLIANDLDGAESDRAAIRQSVRDEIQDMHVILEAIKSGQAKLMWLSFGVMTSVIGGLVMTLVQVGTN